LYNTLDLPLPISETVDSYFFTLSPQRSDC